MKLRMRHEIHSRLYRGGHKYQKNLNIISYLRLIQLSLHHLKYEILYYIIKFYNITYIKLNIYITPSCFLGGVSDHAFIMFW